MTPTNLALRRAAEFDAATLTDLVYGAFLEYDGVLAALGSTRKRWNLTGFRSGQF